MKYVPEYTLKDTIMISRTASLGISNMETA